ncbi:uncharacterized protein LOC142567822 [Dermacentor variabilis]|uniref:uncharacterized protein LOC142567822 n=1 Tax=Dermacentor variabilis TaxID=34621 RepID=UPI003F5C8BAE
MQCLRCRCTGHARRECKVPRCSKCRRYGHVDSDCVRTDAVATEPALQDKSTELLMDVDEAEEAAKGAEEVGKPAGMTNPSGLASGDTSTSSHGETHPDEKELPASGDTTKSSNGETHPEEKKLPASRAKASENGKSVPARRVVEPANSSPNADPSGGRAVSVSAPAKRPYGHTGNEGDKGAATSVEEPPAKTTQARRASLRQRPNVSSERRTGDAARLRCKVRSLHGLAPASTMASSHALDAEAVLAASLSRWCPRTVDSSG